MDLANKQAESWLESLKCKLKAKRANVTQK
jgi:hypothetical protein